MRFICSQQALTKALNTVSKAVTSRTTIPILKGILLTVKESTLTLSASDLDISIEKSIPVHSKEDGSSVVFAKLFGDIVRKLPQEDVEIAEIEGGNVLIRCLSSEFTILGQPADDFPSMGEIQEEQKLSFDKNIFKEMIRKTSFAASIDEARGIITGVLIEMNEKKLTMVSLDGFRMAIARQVTESEEYRKIIIPARILNEISKIIVDSTDSLDESISMILDDKKAVVLLDHTKIILRLLEGEFIKYKDIIPKEHKCRVVLKREDLYSSIERASLLAKEGKNNLVKIEVKENTMIITSHSEEGNVKEEVLIEKEGIDLEIGFNSKYVMDVLKVITDETLVMEFNSNISPCLIKPVLGEEFEYIVLPVRITGN